MQVNFNSAQTLGGKSYAKGVQQVPDRLMYSPQFRALIKSGAAKMLPKSTAEQKMQANKDKSATAHALTLSKRVSAPEGEAHALAKSKFKAAQAMSPATKRAAVQAQLNRRLRIVKK